MVKHGALQPMLDAAIFADTKAEPAPVYTHLDWVINDANLPFPLYVVTSGNLYTDNYEVRHSKRSDRDYLNNSVPMFVRNHDGSPGLLVRRCTNNYKIIPVQRKVKELVGKPAIKAWKEGDPPLIRLWMGISLDETIRMKQSLVPWIENYYPLVDNRLTRLDCLNWTRNQGYADPPRSSCSFCPYHNDAEWQHLKETLPEDFEKAAAFEDKMQEAAKKTALNATPFLHHSLKPLREVEFSARQQWQHHNFFNDNFNNECDGMCGV